MPAEIRYGDGPRWIQGHFPKPYRLIDKGVQQLGKPLGSP